MDAAPAPDRLHGLACTACGAAMRPAAPWCTLCLAPVRGAEPAAPHARPALHGRPQPDPELDPLTAPLHVLLGEPAPAPPRPAPGWPCATCGRTNDLDDAACGGCGEGFLSVVAAAEAASLRLPLVGDLRALTPGQRRMVNIAVVLLVLVLLAVLGVLMALVG